MAQRRVPLALLAGGLATAFALPALSAGSADARQATGPAAAGTKFVSVLFGRAQYAVAAACHPAVIPPDGKTLSDVAALFHAHGWQGTTNVVVDYADAGLCGGTKDCANWAELAALQSTPYKWQSISASQSYPLD